MLVPANPGPNHHNGTMTVFGPHADMGDRFVIFGAFTVKPIHTTSSCFGKFPLFRAARLFMVALTLRGAGNG